MYGDEELRQELERHLRDLLETMGPIEVKVNDAYALCMVIAAVGTLLLIVAEVSRRKKLAMAIHETESRASAKSFINEVRYWVFAVSLFGLFFIQQDLLLLLFDIPFSRELDSYRKGHLASDSYSNVMASLMTVFRSLMIKVAIMTFTAALLASHWILFLARRVTYLNSIKSIDYVYFSLGLLALYVNFSNLFDEGVLFRRALAIDLAMTAVALRIAKTTAEICRWHR